MAEDKLSDMENPSETEEYLAYIKQLRKSKRAFITTTFNKLSSISQWSRMELDTTLMKLNLVQKEIEKFDSKVLETLYQLGKSNEIDEEQSKCDEYEDKLLQIFAAINYCNVNSQQTTSHSGTDSSNSNVCSFLKTPTIEFPVYKGLPGEDFTRFLTEFELKVNKYNFPPGDKFILLKQQVKGRAADLIGSLELSNQTYDHAKNLLIEALANPTKQKFDTICQIESMKLSYNDEPFAYYSKMNQLIENVKNLNIGADDFMQYFFWRGLNDSFKHQFTMVANETKPDLSKIKNHYFEVCDRYNVTQEKYVKHKNSKTLPDKVKNLNQTSSYAVNVNYSNVNPNNACSLCTKETNKMADHIMTNCPVYRSPWDKLAKIKHYSGCVQCSRLDHNSSQCLKREFRCKCNGRHYQMLCTKSHNQTPQAFGSKQMNANVDMSTKQTKATKSPKNISIKEGNMTELHKQNSVNTENRASTSKVTESPSNNIAISLTAWASDISDSNTILPTFSCAIKGKSNIRSLRDSGSQDSFILTNIAEELNLTVLEDDIHLRINGFNQSRNVITKTVEVPLQIGNATHSIRAICIPSFKINLSLPYLPKVVESFLQKGYNLADKDLNTRDSIITNIQFLLGAKSAYCLKAKDIGFGRQDTSVYSKTDAGVVLMGDTLEILKDLPFLPRFSEASCTVHLSSVSRSNPQNYMNSGLCSSASNVGEGEHVGSALENIEVMEDSGKINHSKLLKATHQVLNNECNKILNIDYMQKDYSSTELNQKLIKFTLDNTFVNENRLYMPLLWNGKYCHLLGKNRKLATAILQSNLSKLRKNPEQLKLTDEVFREQERMGILERIPDLEDYLNKNPNYSFLPHMSIFKMDRETTKCRVVYLSNLGEQNSKQTMTVSHNQAMFPGPCLNFKLSASLMHLRFDRYILIYDLKKAFNQIALSETDACRLLCLWYADPLAGDFSIVGYKNVRLPFGLRPSPTILCLGLYYIMVVNIEHDPPEIKDLKKGLYQLLYVDNGAITSNSTEQLAWSYENLRTVFTPYSFEIQQVVTNNNKLQNTIDETNDSKAPEEIKLLGVVWNHVNDTIGIRKLELHSKANTKRTILTTIASQYDLLNVYGPILNRSRLFLHKLQCDKSLKWDEVLSDENLKEWSNIVKQTNATPIISLPRMVGVRDGKFDLVACCDASKSIYGVVVYLKDRETGTMSFLQAKNRLVNVETNKRTIPNLELQAILLATQTLVDVYEDLAGESCLLPIKIIDLQVYTDSLVALHWMHSYTHSLSKMQKQSVYTLNRLSEVLKLCDSHTVKFGFLTGTNNPGDAITRCLSYNQLMKTEYFTGPNLQAQSLSTNDALSVIIPNPNARAVNEVEGEGTDILDEKTATHLNLNVFVANLEFGKYSFNREVRTLSYILKFLNNIKVKLFQSNNLKYEKYQNLTAEPSPNFILEASNRIIAAEQRKSFPEISQYFDHPKVLKKDIPMLVKQLNVFRDNNGLLRVKSKFERFQSYSKFSQFPILLSKNSKFTENLVMDMHEKLSHANCYTLLSELRKRFYIISYFSFVKRILRKCVSCKRYNQRPIKLNQSSYHDWRTDPVQIPFAYVFVDYMGPFLVKVHSNVHQNKKVWILGITCMYTRAINLIVCNDLSVSEFLRAFQIHCFSYGIPQYVLSDLGSQIVAASRVIEGFLRDAVTQSNFEEMGVRPLKFDQFFKGCSQLGSMIEILVKAIKKLMYSSIGKNILTIREFEYLVSQTIHILNRRPIAFQSALRDIVGPDVPEAITPESLIRGYNLPSFNIIPEFQEVPVFDPDWAVNPVLGAKTGYSKIQKVRKAFIDLYNNEFLQTLISQATDKKDRYQPIRHESLEKGDIVLIKDPNTKSYNYPMAIVEKVTINHLGEVTGAELRKGGTREKVLRHSSAIIPILRNKSDLDSPDNFSKVDEPNNQEVIHLLPTGHQRRAAAACRKLIGTLVSEAAI